MSKFNLMTKMQTLVHTTGFALKKYSPEILIAVGVVGVVTSAVMACKATMKVPDILDDAKSNIDDVHAEAEAEESKKPEEETQKDLAAVYVKTGVQLAKLYAPSVILGGLSLASIVASNNILRSRNVALGVAYATLDKGFKDYRSRVVERFGEQVENEIRTGVKTQIIQEEVTNPETGEKETITKEEKVMEKPVSDYMRVYCRFKSWDDEHREINNNWQSNMDYNRMFLRSQLRYANDLLRVKKRVFLNDVLEMLDLPTCKAGQIVGWVYDPDNAETEGDGYISFGNIEDTVMVKMPDGDYDEGFILDFNVDGNILDDMDKKKE